MSSFDIWMGRESRMIKRKAWTIETAACSSYFNPICLPASTRRKGSSNDAAQNSNEYASISRLLKRRAWPQSNTQSLESFVMSKLPGCGSQLKMPACVKEKAKKSMRSWTTRIFSLRLALRSKSFIRSPSMNSMAKTRDVTNFVKTQGMTMSTPWASAVSLAFIWLSASLRKSSSDFVKFVTSRTMSAMSSKSTGETWASSAANNEAARMSTAKFPRICRCCTLMTPSTSLTVPSGPGISNVARCTCAIVALPNGGPGCKRTRSLQFFPNSSANVFSTSECGSAGIES
mmetsp:Transcript_13501/g.38816  ORF Transcript_13501/g.38816 Transcript_13501/m.38816 type:complete len:288 (+) Transcript_13501:1371-2234(+)